MTFDQKQNAGSLPAKYLYQGLIENDADKVFKALRYGADIKNPYKFGKTHLMIALENHCSNLIIIRLLSESDVNAEDDKKKSPLMYALENSADAEIISLLLKKGADVNARDINFNSPFKYFEMNPFFGVEIRRELLRAGAYIHDNLKKSEINLLNAIQRNDIDSVKEHIAAGVDVNVINNAGRSALLYALIYDVNYEIAIELMNYGADVNIADQCYFTPLLYAINRHRNKEVIIQLIYHGADINEGDQRNRSPLFYALMNRKCESDIIWMLINIGADINTQDSWDKKSVLHYAIENEHCIDIILQLVNSATDLNLCDVGLMTPLMYAVKGKDRYELYNYLATAGLQSDHVHPSHVDDDYSISYADVYPGPVTVLPDVLISTSGEVSHEKSKNDVIVRWKSAIILALLKKGAKVNMADYNGNTVLHYNTSSEFIRLLVKNGASLKLKNKKGKTPLMTAVICSNYDRVKILLSLGADPNCLDQDLNTPLHFARSDRITNILVQYGANVITKNRFNQTPLAGFPNFNSALVKQMLLLDESVFNEIDFAEKYFTHFDIVSCKLEFIKMKTTFIKEDLTFYEFCTFKKSKYKKYIDISPSECIYTYEQIQMELFPNYYDIIKLKLDFNKIERSKQCLLRDIYEISVKPLNDCSQFDGCELYYDCLYTVCRYLSLKEVYNLFLASID